jgi:hypothetical protein
LYAEAFEKSNPNDIVDLCYKFHRKFYANVRFLIDGSNAGFVRQMKVIFGEEPNYDPSDTSLETQEIVPISFSAEHKQLLSHLYMMINKGYLAIPEKFDKLIISLRTAQATDSLDALRLSLKGYLIE